MLELILTFAASLALGPCLLGMWYLGAWWRAALSIVFALVLWVIVLI